MEEIAKQAQLNNNVTENGGLAAAIALAVNIDRERQDAVQKIEWIDQQQILNAAALLVQSPTGPKLLPIPWDALVASQRSIECVKHIDLESFCEFMIRFKNETSYVKAHPKSFQLTGIIDGNNPGGSLNEHPSKFNYTLYTLVKDPLFEVWENALSGKTKFSQVGLANFLEEVDTTVAQPDAATLRSLILNLSQIREVKFQSKINVTDGQVNFAYANEETGNGKISIPDRFTVRCPVALNRANTLDFEVLLRYRVDQVGNIEFHLQCPRLAQLVNAWWLTEIETVKRLCGMPVFITAE